VFTSRLWQPPPASLNKPYIINNKHLQTYWAELHRMSLLSCPSAQLPRHIPVYRSVLSDTTGLLRSTIKDTPCRILFSSEWEGLWKKAIVTYVRQPWGAEDICDNLRHNSRCLDRVLNPQQPTYQSTCHRR